MIVIRKINPDFDEYPELEFTRGFTTTYSTLNHAKSQGLEIHVQVPASWMSREGHRPTIVQFFKAKYGRSFPYLNLMISPIPMIGGRRPTQREIDALFTPTGLKELVPDNAVVVESKPIVIEGLKGGMLVYDMTEQRLDMKFSMRMLAYNTVFRNKMIALQFAVGGDPDDRQKWEADFAKNQRLFQLITNSMVIVNK